MSEKAQEVADSIDNQIQTDKSLSQMLVKGLEDVSHLKETLTKRQEDFEGNQEITEELIKSIASDEAAVAQIVELAGYQGPEFSEEIQKAMDDSESILVDLVSSQEVNHESLVGMMKGVMETQLMLAKSIGTIIEFQQESINKSLDAGTILKEGKGDTDLDKNGDEKEKPVEKSLDDAEFGEDHKLDNITQMMGAGDQGSPKSEEELLKSFGGDNCNKGNALIEKALSASGHKQMILSKQAEFSTVYRSDFSEFFNNQTKGMQNIIRKQL